MSDATLAPSPIHTLGPGLEVRLLALVCDGAGGHTLQVSARSGPGAAWQAATLRHDHGETWTLHGLDRPVAVSLGSPNAVFALAAGGHAPSAAAVTAAAPHWPRDTAARLAAQHLSGPGTVAFDAAWFLTALTHAAMDAPLVLLDATSKLGLHGMARAARVLEEAMHRVERASDPLATLLLRTLDAEHDAGRDNAWGGEGRILGEHVGGGLAPVGASLGEGCQDVLGTGELHAVFEPHAPLGLELVPLIAGPASDPEGPAALGAEVDTVAPGGAAARAGVTPGMVVCGLGIPPRRVSTDGSCGTSLADIEGYVYGHQVAGEPIAVRFDTRAPVSHVYAVEVPAVAALDALAAQQAPGGDSPPAGAEPGTAMRALCGPGLLWHETPARLFLGEPGSGTRAHVDLCPQLQLAYGLLGTKLLGVASHAATPRLLEQHARAEQDAGATRVCTNRPLTARQAALLRDEHVSVVLLMPGDLAVFDSGALHFASNGAHGPSGAVFHGAMTPAALPRLQQAARRAPPDQPPSADNLSPSDLLQLLPDGVGALVVDR